ncbi:MAG: AAA family ATPase [Planctomycetes bacterium]|nr:AAA family ATPase [Planctomycetota bacterium]
MKLTRLSVRRMPGFEDRGFDLEDLSGGLNLIVGPNASGKTTTCRAIRGLLWPETLKAASPVSLAGCWRDDAGDEILIEVEGGRRTCQGEGGPAELPALPPPHLAECFTVTVSTLLQATDSDARLIDSVVREMAGGYDLDAVAERFRVSTQFGRKEARALHEADQEVRRVQQRQRALQDDEAELDRLDHQADEARRAESGLRRLEDVRELLDARALIAEAARSLEQLPAGMDRLSGNELDVLQQLRSDLDTESGRLAQARHDAGQARIDRDAAALGEGGIAPAVLKEQQARLESLRQTEGAIDQVRREIVRARSQVDDAKRRLGAGAEAGDLDAIDAAALDAVEALHRDAERLTARRTAVVERLAALGPEQPAEDPDTLIKALDLLRQWWEASGSVRPGPGREKLVAWVLAAVLVAAGVAGGLLVAPWAWVVAGAGIVGAAALWALRAPAVQDGRQACRERYERLGVDGPQTWDRQGVGKLIHDLEERHGRAKEAQRRQAERQNRQAELDQLQAGFDDLDRRRAELVRRLGVCPPMSDLALVAFAQDLIRHRQAAAALGGLQEQLDQLAAVRGGQLAAVNEFLVGYGQAAADGYDVARVRSEAVADRAERYRAAADRLAAAEQVGANAQQRMDELLGRKRRFFEDLGLADEDDAALAERLRRLDEYRELQRRLTGHRGREAAMLGRLCDAPELQAMTREALEEREAALRDLAGRHQGLVDRIARVRAEVEQVSAGDALQEALAQRGRAAEQLTACREQAVEAAAGRFLLGLVRQEQQTEHQPAVVRRARGWLSEFTRGRYDLRVEGGAGGAKGFGAFDTTRQRWLGLDELSGGTRMQLLLAVRLAFAAGAEGDHRLPFVLDEALSGSDPTRFRAIVECLAALIRQGRQVFYLTCQPGDAEAWREVTAREGLGDARHFDLARVRDLQQPGGDLLAGSAAAADPVPAPQGRTLADYAAALNIPAFDPAAGAAGLHVACLLDAPQDLYNLLRVGIQRYGQLESLLGHGRADAYLPAAAARRAAAKAAILQAVCDCWKVGRGRPLTREALQAAGVSDSFIDRVSDLAADLGWDAARLVAVLEARDDERAKGFRASALDAVREGLIAEGYLDPRTRLTDAEALARVLAAANEPLRAGCLDLDEVHALFRRSWSSAAGGGQNPPDSPPQAKL